MSVPMSGDYYTAPPQVDFGWLGKGWDLFKAQAGVWVGIVLLFFVITGLVLGVTATGTGVVGFYQSMIASMQSGVAVKPPASFQIGITLVSLVSGIISAILLGGVFLTGLRQARGEAISIGGLFSGFPYALPLIVVSLASQVISLISGLLQTVFPLAGLLFLIPTYIVLGLLMFAPLFVVDKQMGPVQAMSESVRLLKSQWLMAALFFFVAALVGGLGVLGCGVGLLATYPIFFLSIVSGYLAFTQPAVPVLPNYGQAAPGVWPPPPTATQQTPGVFAQPSAPPPAAEVPSIADPPPPAAPANPFGQPANAAANPFGSPPASSQNPFGQTPPRTSLSGEPLDENGQVIAPPPANPPRPPESQ